MRKQGVSNYKLPYLIVFIALLITVIFGYFAISIKLNPDINALMPKVNDRINRLEKNLGIEDKVTQYLFLSIEGNNNYTLEKLNLFSDVITKILSLDTIEKVISPFNLVTFVAEGRRIIPVNMSSNALAPQNEEELRTFVERLSNDYIAADFVVADHGRILTAIFTNTNVADPGSFMDNINEIIKPLNNSFDVHISGDIPLGEITGKYLSKDLRLLLSLSLIIMMLVFFLSFRTKRAVILPMLVVVIGTIWTVGFMSLLGYAFTIVSIIIPPLLLTIGSSYTIHLLNEYYRKSQHGNDNKDWIIKAVKHITNTILLAGLTTLIGFSSLLITSITVLREFGLSFSFGVIACVVLSLFFLPSMFYILPEPKEKHGHAVRKGRFTQITISIGTFSIKHPFFVLSSFIIIIILAVVLSFQIKKQSDYLSYFPENDKVVKDTRFIIQNTGGSQSLNITFTAPSGVAGYFLQPDILKTIDDIEQQLIGNPDVINSLSFTTILKSMNKSLTGNFIVPEGQGLIQMLYRYYKIINKDSYSLGSQSSLISEDGSSLTIFLKVFEKKTQRFLSVRGVGVLIDNIKGILKLKMPQDITYSLWGNTLLYIESNDSLDRDQIHTTLLSLILVFLVSLIYFRSMLYAIVSILPLITSISTYFIFLAIFKIPLDMTTVLVTNVAIGVGLDDALHFLSQYKYQKSNYIRGIDVDLLITMERTGRPIVLTTLSLSAGLLVLCFASFKPIVYFGLLIAGTLFTAMLATVFLLPAILVIAKKAKLHS